VSTIDLSYFVQKLSAEDAKRIPVQTSAFLRRSSLAAFDDIESNVEAFLFSEMLLIVGTGSSSTWSLFHVFDLTALAIAFAAQKNSLTLFKFSTRISPFWSVKEFRILLPNPEMAHKMHFVEDVEIKTFFTALQSAIYGALKMKYSSLPEGLPFGWKHMVKTSMLSAQ
jgi:hypothetical protein